MNPTLRELVLVEVIDLVVPEHRTNTMNFSQDMIDALTDEYHEQRRINRDMVAKTIGRGMDVSENSWRPKVGRRGEEVDLHRYRFTMMIDAEQCTRHQPGVAYLISGFTGEIYESDLTDLDERAEMYINQIVEYRTRILRDDRGDEYTDHQVVKIILVQRKDVSDKRHHSSRVEDVLIFTDMAHSNLSRSSSRRDDIVMTNARFRNEAKAADFRELTRSTFMYALIDADYAAEVDTRTYNEAIDDHGRYGNSRYDNACYTHAKRERLTGATGIINFLAQRNSTVTQDGIFEYRDLIDLIDVSNPDYDELCEQTDIVLIADNDIKYYSEEFYGKSSKMRSVIIACQEIPAMMQDYHLSHLNFHIDNEEYIDGRPECAINDFATIVRIRGTEHNADVCLRRILSEVFDKISDQNRRYVRIEVDAHSGGMVHIRMEYDHERPEDYRFPTNMSGIFGSTTSRDQDNTYEYARRYHEFSQSFVDRVIFENDSEDDRSGRTYNRWSEE